jgi:DNA modification methylase
VTEVDRAAAYGDANVTVHLGDAREVLLTLPAASIDCCVTSPPYWGLRDYGLEPQLWGGDPTCRHRWDHPPADLSDGGVLCRRCDAWLGHLGLEASPELYTRHLVEVFRAVRRTLKPSGTVWLNVGDCHNAGTTAPRRPSGSRHGYWQAAGSMGDRRVHAQGLKVKDLVGMPWRVALALQADGWYLRSDIVWAKPNAMPESVRDRPMRAHEYVFLLSAGPRYFYDGEAAARPFANPPHPAGRTRGTVWTISNQPRRGVHFATFPELLVEPCILAGTSQAGCCPGCGEPWRRRVEVTYGNPGNRRTNGPRSLARRRETQGFRVRLERRVVGTTWEPACACGEEPVPAVVLDPFAGSGTTLAVAARLGRRGLGVELNPDYVELIRQRCSSHIDTHRRRAT